MSADDIKGELWFRNSNNGLLRIATNGDYSLRFFAALTDAPRDMRRSMHPGLTFRLDERQTQQVHRWIHVLRKLPPTPPLPEGWNP